MLDKDMSNHVRGFPDSHVGLSSFFNLQFTVCKGSKIVI